MPVVEMPDGAKVSFPDDMPKEQIRSMILKKFPSSVKQYAKPGTYADSYLGQDVSGALEGIANIAGLPADATNWVTRKATEGINNIAGTNIQPMEISLPGSQKIKNWMRNAGGIVPDSSDPSKNFTRRVAQEVGAVVIPGLGELGVAEKPISALRNLFAASLASGVGAATANQVAPGNPWAEFAGQLAGGLSVPGAIRLGQRIAPLSAAQKAENALRTAIKRSGNPSEDITSSLRQAVSEGQPEYAVVDALGRPGQRMLSGVTRSIPEVSQGIQNSLLSRQSGQADRLGSFIADAFDAPNSATATQQAMKDARARDAAINYSAASDNASPVNVRNALNVIDERIGPMQGTGISGDGIDAQFSKFRDRLAATDPITPEGAISEASGTNGVLSDFKRVLGVKQDVQDAISTAKRAGRNNEARELTKLSKALDTSLEESSSGYRQANDAFARASRNIDQIDVGQQAAGSRWRPEDTIETFNRLTPDEQAAFKVGYAEPHITKIRSSAEGANKARPFTSQKFQQESGVMASDPELLSRRLGREGQMFSTGNTVLGGSRTADNLIDMKDSGQFDSGVLASLLRGHIMESLGHAARPAVNHFLGRGPAMQQSLGQMLTKTGNEGADLIQQIQNKKPREYEDLAPILRSLFTAQLSSKTGSNAPNYYK